MSRTVVVGSFRILQHVVANDDVEGLSRKELTHLRGVGVAKRNLRRYPASFCVLACDPEHLFGTIEQHNLIVQPRELDARKACATTDIERAVFRCIARQEVSQVGPGQLGPQPARRVFK